MKSRTAAAVALALCWVFQAAASAATTTNVTFASAALGTDEGLIVVQPAGLPSDAKEPVLYLLHGAGAKAADWLDKTHVAQLADKYSMIVVAPEGGQSWYLDSPLVATSRYETMICSELIPYVDSHYSTIASPAGRGVSGMGMGGYGAVALGTRHPELFGTVSAMGAVVDLRLQSGTKQLAKLLGTFDKSPDVWKQYSASTIALKAATAASAPPKPAELPYVYLIAGAADPNADSNRALHLALRSMGAGESLVEHPGAVNWAFVDSYLEEVLLFHRRSMDAALKAPMPAKQPVRTITLASKSLGKDTSFNVLTPPGFDPAGSKRYPVLYLLHGAYGAYVDWYKNSNIGSYMKDVDFIVVMPDGSYMPAYIDSPLIATAQYETFISKELVAYMDANYPTIATVAGRGIAGLSMGGHGAITLAAKHPDVFGSASSLSGVLDIARHASDWDISKMLGTKAKNPAIWAENSALQRALVGKIPHDLPMLISVGADDPMYAEDRDFHNALALTGIAHSYAEHPGAHTWDYWDTHIRESFIFHEAVFAKARQTP